MHPTRLGIAWKIWVSWEHALARAGRLLRRIDLKSRARAFLQWCAVMRERRFAKHHLLLCLGKWGRNIRRARYARGFRWLWEHAHGGTLALVTAQHEDVLSALHASHAKTVVSHRAQRERLAEQHAKAAAAHGTAIQSLRAEAAVEHSAVAAAHASVVHKHEETIARQQANHAAAIQEVATEMQTLQHKHLRDAQAHDDAVDRFKDQLRDHALQVEHHKARLHDSVEAHAAEILRQREVHGERVEALQDAAAQARREHTKARADLMRQLVSAAEDSAAALADVQQQAAMVLQNTQEAAQKALQMALQTAQEEASVEVMAVHKTHMGEAEAVRVAHVAKLAAAEQQWSADVATAEATVKTVRAEAVQKHRSLEQLAEAESMTRAAEHRRAIEFVRQEGLVLDARRVKLIAAAEQTAAAAKSELAAAMALHGKQLVARQETSDAEAAVEVQQLREVHDASAKRMRAEHEARVCAQAAAHEASMLAFKAEREERAEFAHQAAVAERDLAVLEATETAGTAWAAMLRERLVSTHASRSRRRLAFQRLGTRFSIWSVITHRRATGRRVFVSMLLSKARRQRFNALRNGVAALRSAASHAREVDLVRDRQGRAARRILLVSARAHTSTAWACWTSATRHLVRADAFVTALINVCGTASVHSLRVVAGRFLRWKRLVALAKRRTSACRRVGRAFGKVRLLRWGWRQWSAVLLASRAHEDAMFNALFRALQAFKNNHLRAQRRCFALWCSLNVAAEAHVAAQGRALVRLSRAWSASRRNRERPRCRVALRRWLVHTALASAADLHKKNLEARLQRHSQAFPWAMWHKVQRSLDLLLPSVNPLTGCAFVGRLVAAGREDDQDGETVMGSQNAFRTLEEEADAAAGVVDLRAANTASDTRPIDPHCTCYTCQRYSRTYLHHLFLGQNQVAQSLIALHNLHFTCRVVAHVADGDPLLARKIRRFFPLLEGARCNRQQLPVSGGAPVVSPAASPIRGRRSRSRGFPTERQRQRWDREEEDVGGNRYAPPNY